MIEYLKSVLGQQMAAQRPETNEDSELDNSTILEYASLFQELDDLSEKGTAIETAVRTPISIPLEDDIELDSIEINLTDGRVTDIPADATVQESTVEDDIRELEQIEQQYAAMKTYQYFFEEAYHQLERFPRESDERFEARVAEKADIAWNKYNDYLYQEGVFGHGKIDLNDLSVPDKIYLDFGKTSKSNTRHYSVTIPILWETDKKGRITKKQIDSVQVWSKFGTIPLEKMTNEMYAKISKMHNIPDNKEKWDALTPVNVIVPIKPDDKYCIGIGFESEFFKGVEYMGVYIPVRAIEVKDNADVNVPDNAMGDVKRLDNVDKMNIIRKRDYKFEQAAIMEKEEEDDRPSRRRFWQEAIDFGNDAGSEADASAVDQQTEANAPAVENNFDAGADETVDSNGEIEDNAPSNEKLAPDAEDANVNDVSDQIADKVSQTTEDQTEGEDVSIDSPDGDATEPEDVNAEDVDSEIDSLDDTGADTSTDNFDENEGSNDMTSDDLDDMTIDELLAQGAEKLKGMTLNQLKTFITSPDGTTPDDVANTTTESYTTSVDDEKVMMENFFTDASNIRKRIKVAIEDVVPGLIKIKNNCGNGKWDRYKFREFWRDVPDDESELGGERHGEQFRSMIADLRHFLRVANKKRARDIFTEMQLSDINDCNVKLDNFSRLCDKASKTIYIKEDVSMSELSEWADITLKTCMGLKKMVESDEFAEFYIQEAMFVTKKNINKELSSHIKISLGILNNTENDFQSLVKSFKDESKKLNKLLTKAAGFDSVYNPQERNELVKMNKDLLELSSNIRMNNLNDSYTARVKSSIKEYANQCKVVSEIIDKKTGKPVKSKKNDKKDVKKPDTPVQEAVVQEGLFTTKKNIKSRINNQLDAVEKGFKKIIKGITKDDWSKIDLKRFWGVVRNGSSSTLGVDTQGNVVFGGGATYTGESFSDVVAELRRLLELAKTLRIRKLFKPEELDAINSYRKDLEQLRKIVYGATKDYNNDYSLTDVSDKIDDILVKTPNIKNIVSSKEIQEAFNEIDLDTDDIIQEMGCSASLTNIKNQLMNSAGDEFEVGGGGYTPKVVLKSKIVPPVSISITENGKNIELVPEYNNIPDFSKKRRGISINGATQTILDFAHEVVESYKSKTPAPVKEDASETPELGETTTANTTTGVDTTAASATPSTPSGTPVDTPATTSAPSGTPDTTSAPEPTSVNECGETNVVKRFEEFMNSY